MKRLRCKAGCSDASLLLTDVVYDWLEVHCYGKCFHDLFIVVDVDEGECGVVVQ